MTNAELIRGLNHIAFIMDRLGDVRKATIIKNAVSLIEKLTAERYDNAEHCIVCGEIIPEGRQVCPDCLRGGPHND